MLGAAILWIGLGAVGAGDYIRPLGAKALDQPALDAEGFGDKKALAREDDGLKVTLAPGEVEAGWKTPQVLRIGGDFTIVANVVIRKLPKPGQDDGAAVGLAIATGNLDQPEATLVRELEPAGADVYRPIDKGDPNQAMMAQQQQQQQMMMMNRFGGGQGPPPKPAKPPRHTFPARGPTFRLELTRKGPTLRYQVFDDLAAQPREIGQYTIGPGDIAGVKLFASNRNATEPVEVVFRDLTVRADRIGGLGTAVRTISGKVVHGDPTAIEGNTLVVGGPPPQPKPALPTELPADPFQPAGGAAAPAPMPAVTTPTVTAVAIPAPAPMPTVAAPAVAVGSPFDQAPNALVVVSAAPAAKPGTPPPQGPATPPAVKPKVQVPLNEVESIAFERSATLTGRFLGQPNVDTTMPVAAPAPGAATPPPAAPKPAAAGEALSITPPGTAAPPAAVAKVEPKPNGIRDLHLSLSGLRDAAIKQVTINCPTDKGQASWRLDTAGSKDWPLTLRRAGVESWADLFLEPPAGEIKDKDLTVAVTYADGQSANVNIKATASADPKLTFDPAAPTPALDARVYLVGDEQLFGKLESIGEEAVALTTPWGDRVDVPMSRVIGIYMGMADHKESPESFAKRLKARGAEDLLLARAKDGEVVPIAGIVEAAKDNKLTFRYQDKSRNVALKQVEGLVLASRPDPAPPTEVRPTFALAGGIAVSGRWAAIEAAHWQVETPWGQTLKLPAADVRTVRFRGGRMSYLSDLTPSRVEETPYFGRKSPFRKDVNLEGGPLLVDGQKYEHGLAVHSRSELTYDLDRRYATFEAVVGFDDAAKKKGRVDCRVFADGKEIYANPDLRADAPPIRLALDVAGAEQLRLVVDYGPNEDTGDRLIWADARLFRPSPTPIASAP